MPMLWMKKVCFEVVLQFIYEMIEILNDTRGSWACSA